MDSEQKKNIERVVEQIGLAKQSGIRVFVSGLTHVYSVLRRSLNDGFFYEANPHPYAEGKLVGKRLLSENDVLRLTGVDVVLLEGHTPEWVYDPSVHQRVHSWNAPKGMSSVISPNLWEIVNTVNRRGIKVRGMDIPHEGRKDIQDQLGFRDHLRLYKQMSRYSRKRMRAKDLPENQRSLLERFLNDDRRKNSLYDPNHLYGAFSHFDWLLSNLQPHDSFLFDFSQHLTQAKDVFREYIKIRDAKILDVVYEEMRDDKTVLLKIGEAHMDDEYAYLPVAFAREKLPYYHFFNFQAHTKEEIEQWEKIKREKGEV